MNIQIFGTKKNFDSKKAERYFKERGIKYQFIDMKEKGLSKGEFQSVCQVIGGYDKLIDTDCKDKDLLALITYIAEEDKAEKILENQSIIKVPVVRNGKQATVGYQPEIWKSWKCSYSLLQASDLQYYIEKICCLTIYMCYNIKLYRSYFILYCRATDIMN